MDNSVEQQMEEFYGTYYSLLKGMEEKTRAWLTESF